jgi:Cd2+/Zn2+-exporting ATPase
MSQIHIKIPLLLPEVPDENDHCITRLIYTLQLESGIENIHVS